MSLSLGDHLSDAGVSKWIAEVGVANAPVPRANIATALSFFRGSMPGLPATMAVNFLRAMDLSRPVRAVTLAPGEHVIAFRVGNESPFKLFYTRSGASPHNSGINANGRNIVRFVARTAVRALESYTTGTVDVWSIRSSEQSLALLPRANTTGVMVLGGGIQLIIPRAHSVLQMV